MIVIPPACYHPPVNIACDNYTQNNLSNPLVWYILFEPVFVGIMFLTTVLPWYLCWTYLPSCWAGAVTTISNVGNAIWNGLQLIAYSMGWFAIATFVFFNKLVQGILLIFSITQIMSQTGGFITFLPYFFLSYLIFYIMYGISMLKPGGSGLPG